MYMTLYTYNPMSKTESPMGVQHWLRNQLADILPAGLGCLSVRRSPCIREHCQACLSGEKHPSHFLSGRIQGRPFAIYVPEEIGAGGTPVLGKWTCPAGSVASDYRSLHQGPETGAEAQTSKG
jgi:hypothetical protein